MLKDNWIKEYIVESRNSNKDFISISNGLQERGIKNTPFECIDLYKEIVNDYLIYNSDFHEPINKRDKNPILLKQSLNNERLKAVITPISEEIDKLKRENEIKILVEQQKKLLKLNYLVDKDNKPLKEKDAINALKIEKRIRKRLRDAIKNYSSVKDYRGYYKDIVLLIPIKEIVTHLLPTCPQDIEKYHIDHIIPCCSFDFDKLEEILKCFHPLNHEWLIIKENNIKAPRDKEKSIFKGKRRRNKTQ